jgi:subtilisin family serine protease
MAAPFASGSCALLMQWGIVNGADPYMYGLKLRSYLCAGAKRDPGITYPNSSWGYGKLCLFNSFQILTGNLYLYAAESGGAAAEAPSAGDPLRSAPEPNSDGLTPAEAEQLIYSDDYYDTLALYSHTLKDLVDEYGKAIVIGNITPNDSAIIHVRSDMAGFVASHLAGDSSLANSLLYTINDFDSLVETNVFPIQTNPNIGLRGGRVILGFLDTGIDYAHPAFIYEDNTSKILRLWDQTVLTGDPPRGFRYGTEYTREQINEALKSDDPRRLVPSIDENGHGTFIAGVACGREQGQYEGVAPDADIIFVKLRPAKRFARENVMLFDDSAVAYQDVNIIEAMLYLIDRSRELASPMVICFGLGTTFGPHDGTSLVAALGASQRELAFVCAAGNEGNARCHDFFTIENQGDTYALEINVGKGETGFSACIWTYAPDKISVSVMSPSGEFVEKVSIKNTNNDEFRFVFYDTTLWVSYYPATDRSGDELAALRFKNPEPGIWRITVYAETIIRGTFHIWLSPKAWLRPDTFLISSSPSNTISEPANSLTVISVGAYNGIDQNIFIDSSVGPNRYGLTRPDLIAPGVRVGGPLPNGDGAHGTMSGTSVAAAHVAGAAALLMEWGVIRRNNLSINTMIIKSMLMSGARRRQGVDYPNNRYGYGQLDLLNTFKVMSTIPINPSNDFFISDSK